MSTAATPAGLSGKQGFVMMEHALRSRVVIAIFRPFADKEAELLDCLRDHMPLMRRLGFVTARDAIVMRSSDGAILEIFEWVSHEAIDAAHHHPEVRALWKRYERCCEYITLRDLAEVDRPFPDFQPLDL